MLPAQYQNIYIICIYTGYLPTVFMRILGISNETYIEHSCCLIMLQCCLCECFACRQVLLLSPVS